MAPALPIATTALLVLALLAAPRPGQAHPGYFYAYTCTAQPSSAMMMHGAPRPDP